MPLSFSQCLWSRLTNLMACITLIKSNEHKVSSMNEEVRRSVTIKMKPSIVKKARVRAVISDKTLGEWLEKAIEEKVEREEKEPK